MSWGGFGHGLLGALGKIGGGLKHGLLDVGTDENPVFKKDPTREALLRLLIGGQKPGPAWQGPEMPPAIAFQRADEALMEKLAQKPAPSRADAPTRAQAEDRSRIETAKPLDEDDLLARDL